MPTVEPTFILVYLDVVVVPQRISYNACKEMLHPNKEDYIIYFHVSNNSTVYIIVYLTDSVICLTAKIPLDELRRVTSNVGVSGNCFP